MLLLWWRCLMAKYWYGGKTELQEVSFQDCFVVKFSWRQILGVKFRCYTIIPTVDSAIVFSGITTNLLEFLLKTQESLGTVAFARSMTWIKGLRMYTYRPRSIEYKCFQFMQNQETLNLNFYFLNGILTRSRLGQLVKNFKVGMKLFRLLRSTINIRLSEWYFD
jgi:hypothetical protein